MDTAQNFGFLAGADAGSAVSLALRQLAAGSFVAPTPMAAVVCDGAWPLGRAMHAELPLGPYPMIGAGRLSAVMP